MGLLSWLKGRFGGVSDDAHPAERHQRIFRAVFAPDLVEGVPEQDKSLDSRIKQFLDRYPQTCVDREQGSEWENFDGIFAIAISDVLQVTTPRYTARGKFQIFVEALDRAVAQLQAMQLPISAHVMMTTVTLAPHNLYSGDNLNKNPGAEAYIRNLAFEKQRDDPESELTKEFIDGLRATVQILNLRGVLPKDSPLQEVLKLGLKDGRVIDLSGGHTEPS